MRKECWIGFAAVLLLAALIGCGGVSGSGALTAGGTLGGTSGITTGGISTGSSGGTSNTGTTSTTGTSGTTTTTGTTGTSGTTTTTGTTGTSGSTGVTSGTNAVTTGTTGGSSGGTTGGDTEVATHFAQSALRGFRLYTNQIVDAVRYVFLAMSLEGSTTPIFEGTLKQDADGTWKYESGVALLLRVVTKDNVTTDYTFNKMTGDFTGDWRKYLAGARELDFTMLRLDTFNCRIKDDQETDNTGSGSMTGTYVVEDIHYTADLTWNTLWSINNNGQEFQQDREVRGTITGAGFTQDVVDTPRMILGMSVPFLESYRTLLKSVTTVDLRVFRFNSVEFLSYFSEGQAVNTNDWTVSGTLLRSGLDYGIFAAEDTGANVAFTMTLPDVEGKITLESYPKT